MKTTIENLIFPCEIKNKLKIKGSFGNLDINNFITHYFKFTWNLYFKSIKNFILCFNVITILLVVMTNLFSILLKFSVFVIFVIIKIVQSIKTTMLIIKHTFKIFVLSLYSYLFLLIHSTVSFIVSFIFLFLNSNFSLAFSLLKLALEDSVYSEYFVKSGVCFFKL